MKVLPSGKQIGRFAISSTYVAADGPPVLGAHVGAERFRNPRAQISAAQEDTIMLTKSKIGLSIALFLAGLQVSMAAETRGRWTNVPPALPNRYPAT
jgi:hypothetical protein